MTDKIVEQLQDLAKLQDTLFLIMHALEGGCMEFPLPTFNDTLIEDQVETIFEMIAKRS